MVQIELELKLC